MTGRKSWDQYFMDIAKKASERSTCLRRQIGAVAVKDNHLLCTGYNGAPTGFKHCTEKGICVREAQGIPSGERPELCFAVHAEQNLICQAARHGISLCGADVYVTTFPCSICAKMLLNVGIKRVFYSGDYPDITTKLFLSKMEAIKLHDDAG